VLRPGACVKAKHRIPADVMSGTPLMPDDVTINTNNNHNFRRFAVLMYVYRPVCKASLVIMKLPPLIAGAVRMNASCSGGRADHCHVSKSMRSRQRIHTSSGYQGFPEQRNSNHYKSR